jgi:hypothetical protein
MAATRYDPNAYMLIEVDTGHATSRFMNIDLVQWDSHYSNPGILSKASDSENKSENRGVL